MGIGLCIMRTTPWKWKADLMKAFSTAIGNTTFLRESFLTMQISTAANAQENGLTFLKMVRYLKRGNTSKI